MRTLTFLSLAVLALWGARRLLRASASVAEPSFGPRAAPSALVGLAAGFAMIGIFLGTGIGPLHDALGARPTERGAGVDLEFGRIAKVDEAFMRHAERRIPPGARIYVACGASCDQALNVWILSRLLPRIPVASAAEADWVIFQGAQPTEAPYDAAAYAEIDSFAPWVGLGRVERPAGGDR